MRTLASVLCTLHVGGCTVHLTGGRVYRALFRWAGVPCNLQVGGCSVQSTGGRVYCALNRWAGVPCNLRDQVRRCTTGVFFYSGPPPIFTKSQAHYKFLYLGTFWGGQFNLHRAWDLVKLGGGQNKKSPCMIRIGREIRCLPYAGFFSPHMFRTRYNQITRPKQSVPNSWS